MQSSTYTPISPTHPPLHSTPHLDRLLLQIIEVRVVQTVLGADALLGGVVEELLEEVDTVSVQRSGHPLDVKRGPLGEGRVPVLQLGDTGPHGLIRGSELAENFEKLIDLRISGEEWSLGDHLDEDGSHGPDVDGGGVGGAAEEDFGGAVPVVD